MTRIKNNKIKKAPKVALEVEDFETEAFAGHFFEIQSGCIDPLDSFFQKISDQPHQRHLAILKVRPDDKD